MFNRNQTGELVVKPRQSPRTKIAVASVIALVVVLGAGGIYNYGLDTAGFQRLIASKKEGALRDQIAQLQKEKEELQGAVARAERSLQMDQTAYQELDQALKVSAKEIVKLREELNFYRNIISPANKKSGLRIQSLNIEPMKDKFHYRYKLVLIQALKHDRTIRGRASFEVSGLQAGKDTILKFPSASEKSLEVNFRYFQDVEGQIDLPKNFEPKQIKVLVTTQGGQAQTVEQVYTWPQA
ncbi:MAG: hypothetical protein OEY67_08340 [Gammaproteobacteria bacterium]|nr:hypothetical protein [Gammaproteobacteria bacterium]